MKIKENISIIHNSDVTVSVLCVVYNHAPYLRKCFDGFVMQKTNFKFEVLVHDDASTDNSAEIIREYELKYPEMFKPIYQTENQYSKGIKVSATYQYPRAKGKYFAFCEGDDYWCDEKKLQKQYDFMEAHPDCTMCAHKVRRYDTQNLKTLGFTPTVNVELGNVEIIDPKRYFELVYKHSYVFQTSSYFMLGSVLTQYCDLGKKMIVGDSLLQVKCILTGNIAYFDEEMSCQGCNLITGMSHTQRSTKNPMMPFLHHKGIVEMFSDIRDMVDPACVEIVDKLRRRSVLSCYMSIRQYGICTDELSTYKNQMTSKEIHKCDLDVFIRKCRKTAKKLLLKFKK